jgi:hypothetical protein
MCHTSLITSRRTQWLLLEEQEAGVDQLDKLGEVVQVVENNQFVRPATLVVADGKEKALANYNGKQLLNEERQQYTADGGEIEVVHLEQKVQLERLAVAHQLAAAKDYNVVCEKCDGACFERGERCLAGHEAEVVRFVADNWLKYGFEDGP